MSNISRADLKRSKRWVIKVGSSVLLQKEGGFSSHFFNNLGRQVASLIKANGKLVIVSSGAIAAGMERMGIKTKPHLIPRKQALAACGQTSLMHLYEKTFSRFGIRVAQILLDREDFANRKRYLNARQAILELWRLGVVPIINENDSVAVEEIVVGDNDNLAALTTNLIEAELLVMLTDMDGVYTGDPSVDKKAKKLSEISSLTKAIYQFAGGTKGVGTVGGMVTKLQAAEKAAHYGAATIITIGSGRTFLSDIVRGKDIGTLILPKPTPKRLTNKKHWLAYSQTSKGMIVVDPGAAMALMKGGKSLLAAGIVKVRGNFGRGDCVEVKPERGKPFAKGLASYSANEMERIKGSPSQEIEKKLGYKYLDEMIHRDDLVLL